jgi:rhamnose transport system permease protein
MSTPAESVAVPASRERRRSGRELVDKVVRLRELGLIVVLALLIGVTAVVEPRFIESESLRNLIRNATIIGLLAVGQTLVLVTRNLDLSVGSVVGLSAYMTGDLFSSNPSLPIRSSSPSASCSAAGRGW